MSIKTYIRMEGEEIPATLGKINYAQGFDRNVDMHSVDVDDVAPPTR
jgi:hypothetical protein